MKVIVSAGGTGGHIYPALAIINKLKELDKDVDILYIGTTDRLEKDLVPSLGINYAGIPIMGLNRKNIFKNIEVYRVYKKAYKSVLGIIKAFKPDVVVGVGGYVTLPVLKAAKKLKIKTFVHEQNSILGLTNKFLIKKADVVGLSMEIPSLMKKENVILTGNPRSEEASNASPIDKRKYNLKNNKKLVVIVMGSLGSQTITDIMKDVLYLFKDKDYEVLFITGKNYYDTFNNTYPKNVKIISHAKDMLNILHKTDLIVTRAGATTIAEITTIGVPSILIPSPFVTNHHQEKNALFLENKGVSLVIKEKDLTKEKLVSAIDSLISDEERLTVMKKNCENLRVVDSATKIVKIIEKLASENSDNRLHKKK